MRKLIYLSHNRPNIAFSFSINVISQHMHSPIETHFEAVYRILGYLKGSSDIGLFFKKNEIKNLEVYTDADCADSLEDRRSTSEYCTFVLET